MPHIKAITSFWGEGCVATTKKTLPTAIFRITYSEFWIANVPGFP